MTLEIVYVGVSGGTCRHRAEALEDHGHRVRRVVAEAPGGGLASLLHRVGGRLGRPPDFGGANRAILRAVAQAGADLLWIDKGLLIRPRTLRRVRELAPGVRIVAYSPDDMLNPTNQTQWYLRSVPLYDLHVTTKSYNVAELRGLGARDVLFVDNAFDPRSHRPVALDAADRERFGADAGFIGGYEPDRAAQMLRLAEAGVAVKIWGYHWDRFSGRHRNLEIRNELIEGDEYSKSIGATRINLGFLRKVNRDLQTTRSIEIPACGGFLLAERTDEHRRLFVEGREADFFGSVDELIAKCRHYLAHEAERARIAVAGRQRCLDDGYSNQDRLATVLAHLAAAS